MIIKNYKDLYKSIIFLMIVSIIAVCLFFIEEGTILDNPDGNFMAHMIIFNPLIIIICNDIYKKSLKEGYNFLMAILLFLLFYIIVFAFSIFTPLGEIILKITGLNKDLTF